MAFALRLRLLGLLLTLVAFSALPHAAALRVLVIGGTGRVGGSTAHWLARFAREDGLEMEVAVGGRTRAGYEAAARRLGRKLPGARFEYVPLDLTDAAALARTLAPPGGEALGGGGGGDSGAAAFDLIVHTAGPFQQKERPEVIEYNDDVCVARKDRFRSHSPRESPSPWLDDDEVLEAALAARTP